MWRNYLTVGFRALTRSRTYAFINIFGLALGLAACLILFLYVRYETSYDEWLPNSDRTYQLQTHYEPVGSDEPQRFQITSFAAAQAIRNDFPQVDGLVYALPEEAVLIRDGSAELIEDALFVDGPFFELLQFPFLRGDRETALAAPGSVVLTQSEASRHFGTADPIGQTLTIETWGKTTDYRVTGVVEDPPKNSHARFRMVARFDPSSFFADMPDILTNWGWQSGYVYLRLRPGTDAEAIRAALPAWERRNIPDQDAGGVRSNLGDEADWRLVNVSDVHLGEAQAAAMTPGNDRRTIATLAVVAALILGIAAVNFINLTTARAGQRSREIALRKVLGARRKQLIVQFLGESLLLAAVAMLLALTMLELTLPTFGRYLDAPLSLDYFGTDGLVGVVAALVLAVGGIGGLYPAFYLSRYQPAAVLKAKRSSAEPQGAGRLRNLLVVLQFAVSICQKWVHGRKVFWGSSPMPSVKARIAKSFPRLLMLSRALRGPALTFEGRGMTTSTTTPPWLSPSLDAEGFTTANEELLSLIRSGGFTLSQFGGKVDPERQIAGLMWRHYIVYWSASFAARNTATPVKNLVECGVCDGLTASYALSAVESFDAHTWLYDAWGEMPAFMLSESERFHEGGYDFLNMETAVRNLARFLGRTTFNQGYIPEVFTKADNPTDVTWLHIDLNSSAPTEAALAFFYDRMVPGGVILFDDYSHKGYEDTKAVADRFLASRNADLLHLPTGQAIAFVRQKAVAAVSSSRELEGASA